MARLGCCARRAEIQDPPAQAADCVQISRQRFYLLWTQIREQSFRHDDSPALALVSFSVNVR